MIWLVRLNYVLGAIIYKTIATHGKLMNYTNSKENGSDDGVLEL